MYLTHLSLSEFRNFSRLDQDIPCGPVLLVGSNAQGKTSLLEAIYYLATFESFHAANDRQLVNFLSGRDTIVVARIVADFQRPELGVTRPKTHRIEVRLIQENIGLNGAGKFRKEILYDGVKKKIHEILGKFNAVLFLPQMLRVIEGSPEERRRYLNLAISQVFPVYAAYLSEYNQVLTQRNALLKTLSERGGESTGVADQLSYWDDQLADNGSHLIYHRIQAVQELERFGAATHRDLTRGQEVLRLNYQPSYDPFPQRPGQLTLAIDTPLNRSNLTIEKIAGCGHSENIAIHKT